MNEHAITYCREFLRDGVQVECACGWKTEWLPSDEEAAEEWWFAHGEQATIDAKAGHDA